MPWTRSTLAVPLLLACAACGGGQPAQSAQHAATQEDLPPRDPWALLPPKALALGTLDVQAMFRAGESGKALGQLVSRYLPIGPETGMSLEQNVDKLVCGAYALDSDDVLCVAIGRFDAERFDKALTQLGEASESSERADASMKLEEYAGQKMYTAQGAGLVRLDAQHVIAGRARVVRAALDRLAKEPTPSREQTPATLAAVHSEAGDLIAAADFQDQPMGVLSFGPVRLRALQGLREAKLVAHFKKQAVGEQERALATRHDVSVLTWLRYDDLATAEGHKGELERLLGLLRLGQASGYVPATSEAKISTREAATPAGSAHAVIGLGFTDAAMARWIEAAPSTFDLPAPPRRAPSGPVPGADSK